MKLTSNSGVANSTLKWEIQNEVQNKEYVMEDKNNQVRIDSSSQRDK